MFIQMVVAVSSSSDVYSTAGVKIFAEQFTIQENRWCLVTVIVEGDQFNISVRSPGAFILHIVTSPGNLQSELTFFCYGLSDRPH